MADFEAVSALLLLSSGFQKQHQDQQHQQQQFNPAIVENFCYNKIRETLSSSNHHLHHQQPEDLSLKTTTSNKNDLYNPNKRLLSPSQTDNVRRYHPHKRLSASPDYLLDFDKSRTSSPILHSTLTSSSTNRRHSLATMIDHHHLHQSNMYANSPGMQGFVDSLRHDEKQPHGAEHNYATSTNKNLNNLIPDDKIKREDCTGSMMDECKRGINSPSDSGHSSLNDENFLSPPTLPTWSGGNPRFGLTDVVLNEFEKIVRESGHMKEEYTQTKMSEYPIECEYNPKKSRLRKEYTDLNQAADRARNNLASRKSRYKKKVATQLMNINLEFDRSENRQLYQQERWMAEIISGLEEKMLQQGVDVTYIKNLRTQCGFQ